MNKSEAVAYVQAMTACALIEMEGMKAKNQSRSDRGFSQAYDEEAFAAVIVKYGIHHNGVVTMLNEATDA